MSKRQLKPWNRHVKMQKQSESKIAQLIAEMFENQKNLEKSFDEIQLRDLRIKKIIDENLK